MARKGQFKPRPGFERLPGRGREYVDLKTGEILSKRQYTKRTENIRSLEEKRDRLRRERKERGIPPPMRRYDAIVEHYKNATKGLREIEGRDDLTAEDWEPFGKKGRIRGNSPEAIEFQRNYRAFTTRRPNKPKRRKHESLDDYTERLVDWQVRNLKHRRMHLKAGVKIGVISRPDYERYAEDEY